MDIDIRLRVCPICEHEQYINRQVGPDEHLTCPNCHVKLAQDLFDPPNDYVTNADIIRHLRGMVTAKRRFDKKQRDLRNGP